jgi:hypothetical protein
MARAKRAGVGNKDNYNKYPRQMLANRVISEGCRRIYPASTSGLYVPEEVVQFRAEKDITPTAGAMQALPIVRQEIVMETAAEVRTLLANDQAIDAYALIENSNFDNDEKVALWSQFDSKQKGVLGRMKEAEQAEEKGTISIPMHKRLEALIKDLKLDRDALKAWCKEKFSKEHFTELTKEEYRTLDEHIAALPTTAVPTATINDAQESQILDHLEATGVTIKAFCKQATIAKLRDLKTERFDGAVKWLKSQAIHAK